MDGKEHQLLDRASEEVVDLEHLREFAKMVGFFAPQLDEMKGGPPLGELGVVRIRWLPRPARDALANAL